MLISEIKDGSEITVEITIYDQPVLLVTKSIFANPTGILTEPIMIGDGELIWRRPAMINIVDWTSNDTYIFDADSIEPEDSSFGRVHRIHCYGLGKKKKKRGSERMDVIKMGTCFAHGRSYKSIIYDISMSGIAVILDGNVRMRIGDHVTIRFTMGNVDEIFHVFELDAEIVRFFDVKGRVAIGCAVEYMPPELLTEARRNEMKRLMDQIPEDMRDTSGDQSLP